MNIYNYADNSLGTYEGYKKRVYHDVLVDKSVYQDLYISLKNKYAKSLIESWAEDTDPLKHVFEDISLATFLILLWDQSNGKKTKFVDIGCGNGVLVYLLMMEGYEGQGFDARCRKSWNIFPEHVQRNLSEKILIPHFLEDVPGENIHNGIFEDGTFLISNHADELTPYTPLLAALTPGSGFLAIPCCEHDFSGAKAPGGLLRPSKQKSDKGDVGQGRYGMYCAWISEIAKEMGWVVEREMLRIPSTRNVGIVGRYLEGRGHGDKELALDVIHRLGGPNGFQGFIERATGLKQKVHRGH
jgi:tRNASer (uridine44-2'-O)-methyltransferase